MRCSTHRRKPRKKRKRTRGKWKGRAVVFSIQLSATTQKKDKELNDRKKGGQVEDGR